MITIDFNNLIKKITLVLALIILLSPGCNQDFLEEYPKDAISEGIFWNTKADAYQALMGCYNKYVGHGGECFLNLDMTMIWLSSFEGFSSWRDFDWSRGIEIEATHHIPRILWQAIYAQIARDNYFLDNIDKVEMDAEGKAEMIAEVRFLRAFSYFWLGQLYGNVPLIKKTLTFDEANSVTQVSEADVLNFVVTELAEIASSLPIKQPTAEKGRIERGAALALKGRCLMAQKKWSEAVTTYKAIMDLNRYIIDPRFKKLFEDEGDNSDEKIFVIKYMENEYGHNVWATNGSSLYGGCNSINIFQHFVDEFLMNDGMTIEESPLFDPANPFENRDPRLYATLLLSNYTWLPTKNEIFRGDPETIAPTGQTGPNITGYLNNKFLDWEYTGNPNYYGSDYPQIRYAEVLLSRLESELEAGNAIDQNLLDITINQIRQRDEIHMPVVTETDPNKLREIIIRERYIELAFEGGIRYFDLRRWKKLQDEFNRDILGMKITDNPEEYTGKYNINEEGYLFLGQLKFYDYNYLWPIPQGELDINKNLHQNPGYH